MNITEEQKTKLLEMCYALFPEYKHFHILEYLKVIKHYGDHETQEGEFTINFVYYRPDESETFDYNKSKTMHWFEFCMTHLLKAISEKSNKIGHGEMDFSYENDIYRIGEQLFTHIVKDTMHPVDYLYEEFKMLNK